MKIRKGFLTIIIFFSFFIISVVLFSNLSLRQGGYTKIAIRNGSTGKRVVIEDTMEIKNFIKELNKYSGGLRGINVPFTSGYRYLITINRGNSEQYLVIRNEFSICKGILKYKLDKDFIEILEKYF